MKFPLAPGLTLLNIATLCQPLSLNSARACNFKASDWSVPLRGWFRFLTLRLFSLRNGLNSCKKETPRKDSDRLYRFIYSSFKLPESDSLSYEITQEPGFLLPCCFATPFGVFCPCEFQPGLPAPRLPSSPKKEGKRRVDGRHFL